jgi:quercetin dioxygenase-like cupin family protein
MNAIRLAVIVLLAAPAQAAEDRAVVATPVLTSTITATGQPIVLPRENPQVRVVTLDIAPGAVLPEHKHPYPRYGYVLAGTLRVTNTDTGTSMVYGVGDFIIEAVDQWHRGASIGSEPVRLLVIDQVEGGRANVVTRE